MAVGSLITCPHCSKLFSRKSREHFCSTECRFWHKVKKAGPDDCWLWTGTTPSFGHGQFALNGTRIYSHRYSWEQQHGPVPDGQCVLHKCDVAACVNPAHLFLGTREDNMADMWAKKRGSNPPVLRGNLNPFAKLTEEIVREIRSSASTPLELSRRYGIPRRSIYKILSRQAWAHVL